jgi:hypothetical protein
MNNQADTGIKICVIHSTYALKRYAIHSQINAVSAVIKLYSSAFFL